MCEPLVAHHIVGFEGFLEISLMNTQCAPHDHVLWALSTLPIDSQQVGLLQSLVSKEVV